MKNYSILIHVENNNKLAKFCNDKMEECNKKFDKMSPFDFVSRRKNEKIFNYYHSICERILAENQVILDNLKQDNKCLI